MCQIGCIPPAAEAGPHGPGGVFWDDFSPWAVVQARGGPRNAREASSDALRIVTRDTTSLPLESAPKSMHCARTVGTRLRGGRGRAGGTFELRDLVRKSFLINVLPRKSIDNDKL